jgi:hypothetical protein
MKTIAKFGKSSSKNLIAMSSFKYVLKPEDIKPLIEQKGYCYASDMITIEGHKVGYMHREAREDDDDSGWRFYSGHETEEYVENEHHFMMFDLNYVANIDPTIIPYLKMRTGAELERDPDADTFSKVENSL